MAVFAQVSDVAHWPFVFSTNKNKKKILKGFFPVREKCANCRREDSRENYMFVCQKEGVGVDRWINVFDGVGVRGLFLTLFGYSIISPVAKFCKSEHNKW